MKTAYGVVKSDLARQKSKHEQRFNRVPMTVNKEPIIKNDTMIFSLALTEHEEFIIKTGNVFD